MPSIITEVSIDLEEFWEDITDAQFEREAGNRGFHMLNVHRDELLSMCRRDKREALIEIERALGHDFIGLLT